MLTPIYLTWWRLGFFVRIWVARVVSALLVLIHGVSIACAILNSCLRSYVVRINLELGSLRVVPGDLHYLLGLCALEHERVVVFLHLELGDYQLTETGKPQERRDIADLKH